MRPLRRSYRIAAGIAPGRRTEPGVALTPSPPESDGDGSRASLGLEKLGSNDANRLSGHGSGGIAAVYLLSKGIPRVNAARGGSSTILD